jgi:hypothetical protein
MRDDMDVIHLETVAGSRADESCLSNPAANRCADNAGTRSPALLFHEGKDVLGPNLPDSGKAAAQRVKGAGFCFVDNVGRKIFIAKVRRERGKALRRTFSVGG